jgi:hypothetical protein
VPSSSSDDDGDEEQDRSGDEIVALLSIDIDGAISATTTAGVAGAATATPRRPASSRRWRTAAAVDAPAVAARATSKTVSAADAYFQAKNLFFLHFDCEHTSTHLCQISAVCYSQETLEQVGVAFDEYVKPPVHRWNAEATTIHGLSAAHSRIVVAEPLSLMWPRQSTRARRQRGIRWTRNEDWTGLHGYGLEPLWCALHGMEQMIIDGLHAHNSLCDCVGQAQITMTAEFVPFANKPKGIIVLEDVYKAKRERRRKQGREVMWPVPRGWTEYTQASGPAWRTNPAMDYDGGVNNGPKHGPKGAAGTMAEFIQLFYLFIPVSMLSHIATETNRYRPINGWGR